MKLTVFDKELEEWKQESSTPRYKYKVKHFQNLLKKYIHKNNCILELGCGISPYLNHFKNNIKYAIDTSKTLLSLNKDKSTKFYQISATKLPKKWTKKFDVIFCAGLVHHIDNHKLLLKNIYRCLKSNGLFIFIEPASLSLTGIYYCGRLILQNILNKNLTIKLIGFFDKKEKYINYFKFRKLLKRFFFKKKNIIQYNH